MFGNIAALSDLSEELKINLSLQLETQKRIAEALEKQNEKLLPILELFARDVQLTIEEDIAIRQLQRADTGANSERCA